MRGSSPLSLKMVACASLTLLKKRTYENFFATCTFLDKSNTSSLVDCFASYFGSFTCVAFSKDGKFVLVWSLNFSLFQYVPIYRSFMGLRQADKMTL